MPSHLTRSVFRRLLSSEPLVLHPQSTSHGRSSYSRHHARLRFPHTQTRSFLNMFKEKPKRDLAEPLLDPGMREMLTLDKKLHLIVRTQHPEVLQQAFCTFIHAKVRSGQPVEDFHAVRLLQTFEVLEKDQRKPNRRDFWLPSNDLKLALRALATNPEDKLEAVHNTLAKKIYAQLPVKAYKEDDTHIVNQNQAKIDVLVDLVAVLSSTGETARARDMLLEAMAQTGTDKMTRLPEGWLFLLKGFTREDKEPELLKTLELMAEHKLPVQNGMRAVLVLYYARQGREAEVKQWFTEDLLKDGESQQPDHMQTTHRLYQELLQLCFRTGEFGWVESLFEDINGVWQQKAVVLAAAATGKSVDEIDRMLDVFAQHNQAGPDIQVVNSLIEFAASKGDAYNAERYFSLAQKKQIQPDAQTYIHQIGYRLDAGDLRGAQTAYENLREQSIVANEDWEIMNRLVRALVSDRTISKDVIMGLVADISARAKLFSPKTVSALVQYHLARDEYYELIDLLQTYAFQYSIRDRQDMFEALASAALDPKQDTSRTWDTYMIFHQIFDDETKRPLRQAVMERMFARGRPDLGMHVFMRMSRHARADARPDQSTYVAALSGIARNAGSNALEGVHNMLKLDTEVEPNTQIRTALMLAYTVNDQPGLALELWDDISMSTEGPSSASLHAVMRACERSPFGERTARAVWTRLQESDVAIDGALLASYVGALAGTRQVDECKALVSRTEELTGAPADTFVLGTMFNASAGMAHQEEVRDWIAAEYPALWAELEAQGIDEDELGACTVRGIDRSLNP